MDVAALCPFDVGLVRWSAPSPAITIIVKATWELAPGELCLASIQDALSADVPAPGGRGLAVASDFVPYKPRADVVLVGHARTVAATRLIPVRFGVGEFDRVVYAMSAEPSVEIPLATAYLRAAPRSDAREVTVGPRPGWISRPVVSPPEAALVGPSGLTRGPLGADFDFGIFNVAPAEQQLPALREGLPITLEGVMPRGTRLETRLSRVHPRVFLVDGGGAPTRELVVDLDTLAIDVDRGVATTVWRGAIVIENGSAEPVLAVVAAEETDDELTWAQILGDLFAARRLRAAELDDDGALPKLYDTTRTAGDETTTRVRRVYASAPPRARTMTDGDTRRDVRVDPPRPPALTEPLPDEIAPDTSSLPKR